ncbi:hypothetical protein Q4I32_005190 [Leishmania shawi]|uniref:Uncharacterized protein n=1 Tax=Leishmania shawi TaxID=5680 RepID=A0AAW3BMA3_9TRYP|nr:hypothetical protein MNV84_00018 [Leishmania braziliensis]KAI5684799.1 hypothetical protein MNV84_05119 [Leishmania braziliensis]KAI5687169.1 hypothetical protein MNV84_00068 [Leishmania braziliensis]KAI5690173.1 hypothetical protein MNV84_00028 [Leishmania braziliensis]CAJ2465452.1 unnamed protein product [Leishmania braziliensis]
MSLTSTTSLPPAHATADASLWEALAAECRKCSMSLCKCKHETERLVRSMDGVLFCVALEDVPHSVCGAKHFSAASPPLGLL